MKHCLSHTFLDSQKISENILTKRYDLNSSFLFQLYNQMVNFFSIILN
jgi:hypothetical protein